MARRKSFPAADPADAQPSAFAAGLEAAFRKAAAAAVAAARAAGVPVAGLNGGSNTAPGRVASSDTTAPETRRIGRRG